MSAVTLRMVFIEQFTGGGSATQLSLNRGLILIWVSSYVAAMI